VTVLLSAACGAEGGTSSPDVDYVPVTPSIGRSLTPEHHAALKELCDPAEVAGLISLAEELDELEEVTETHVTSERLERAAARLEDLVLDPVADGVRNVAVSWLRDLSTGIDGSPIEPATVAAASEALRETQLSICEGDVAQSGQLVFHTSSDQLQKPHRLTWFAEGKWWAMLRKSSGDGSGWRVWRRNADGTWIFGPDEFSELAPDRFDVFLDPDDGRVFALHLNASQSYVHRLEYHPDSDMYVPEARAPVATAQADAGTLAVDTERRVWVAVHPDGNLAYTVLDADTLEQVSPLQQLPESVQDRSLVAARFADDRGPAVAFIYAAAERPYPGKLMINYDADPVGTFVTEEFAQHVDDHSSIAAEGTDVLVVWKDRRDRENEVIVLVRRRHPDGTWGESTPVFVAKSSVSTGNHTRPRMLLDSTNRLVHVAAAEVTANAAEVHERVAHIDSLQFSRYRTIFRSGHAREGHVFRDVHAGQQSITPESGVLWLARGRDVVQGELGGFSLWENHLEVGVPDADEAPSDGPESDS
jgi:hypothetical protein